MIEVLPCLQVYDVYIGNPIECQEQELCSRQDQLCKMESFQQMPIQKYYSSCQMHTIRLRTALYCAFCSALYIYRKNPCCNCYFTNQVIYNISNTMSVFDAPSWCFGCYFDATDDYYPDASPVNKESFCSQDEPEHATSKQSIERAGSRKFEEKNIGKKNS